MPETEFARDNDFGDEELSVPFDWRRDKADIAVPQQNPIAVYQNGDCDVVIRQLGADFEGDEVIVVRSTDAAALANAILREVDVDAEMGAPTKPKAKDPTAAERQRRYRERQRNADRNADRDSHGTVTLFSDAGGAAK